MTATPALPALRYAWASAQQLVDVTRPVVRNDRVGDLIAIEATIRTYGWAIDENRFDVLRAVLAKDAEFSGVIAGVAALDTVRGRDVLAAWLEKYMAARSDQLRHSLGNIVVTELGAKTATAQCYLTLLATTSAATTVLATAFYRFTLSLLDDEWSVETVFAGFDKAF